MTIRRILMLAAFLTAMSLSAEVQAQILCHREGTAVTCDDGRRGAWSGDAIIWADGTRSRSSPHPSVIIGNKSSVAIGPGVYVGQGKGVVPLDDPNKTPCVRLDDVPYCN